MNYYLPIILWLIVFGTVFTFKIPKVKEELLVKLHHVSDGDTITVLASNGTKIRVRFAFIDAPERNQEFGVESTSKLHDLLKNEPYFKVFRYHTIYGRVLAKVTTLAGLDLNREMVKDGYAWCFRRRCPKEYRQLQKLAKKNQIGLWKNPNPRSPWNYRKSPKTRQRNHTL